MLIELNESQIDFVKRLVDNKIYYLAEEVIFCSNILNALDNPIDITDTCPHCGCTEMLCGHNGSGCNDAIDDQDEEE